MKIAIPTDNKDGLEARVADHFGRCKTYTFIGENGEIIEIIDNISEHAGGEGLPPEVMKSHRADIILCKDIGPKALELCKKLKIEVYTFKSKTVREIFKEWKENQTFK
jgi:predicted Fe-Mo cluster-binding NifX family protein